MPTNEKDAASTTLVREGSEAIAAEGDRCLICLSEAVAPTRLSCDCKFNACLDCILGWVKQTRHNKEEWESVPPPAPAEAEPEVSAETAIDTVGPKDRLAPAEEAPSRVAPASSAATSAPLPIYYATSHAVCPLCRRTDVNLVSNCGDDEEGSKDVSTKLAKEGYMFIARWEELCKPEDEGGMHWTTRDKPAPPQSPQEGAAADELAAYDEALAKHAKLLAIYQEEEKAFKKPLHQAVEHFSNSVAANPSLPAGYVGMCYLALLTSDYKLGRKYAQFVLDHIDPENDDAQRLMVYLIENEGKPDGDE